MSNFTLEDILAEEDPAALPSNQNISIEDILAEDLDKETEKILRELKQKAATPAVNNLPANNNNNQNPKTSKQFIQKEDLQTTSTSDANRAFTASTDVADGAESQELSDAPVPEKKIDEAVLQEILKETEEIDLSAIGGESDLDSLMRNILSERPLGDDSKLLEQITATQRAVVNVEESKKVLSTLEERRRKKRLHTNILEATRLANISNKLTQSKKDAGNPTCIAISLKYVAIGTSHGLVMIFDHFQDLKKILVAEALEYGPVTAVDLSLDSEWVACGHQGGQLVIWDIQSGKQIKSILDAHQQALVTVKFIEAKNRLLTADLKGVLNLFNISRMLLMWMVSKELILSGSVGPLFAIAHLLPGSISHPVDIFSLVAISNATKTMIASFQSEKVLILHQIPRPKTVRDGALPYLAWRRVVMRDTKGGRKKLLDPVLAVGWGNTIELIRVVIQNKPDNPPRLSLDFVSVARHAIDTELCGLQWLGSAAMAYINAADELRVVDSLSFEELEISSVKDMELVFHTRFVNAATGTQEVCYGPSIKTYKGRLYLLGLTGVYSGHLLTWSERINVLVKQSRWLDALALALDFYQGRGLGAAGLPRDANIARGLVSKKIEELLEKFLTIGIDKKRDASPSNGPKAVPNKTSATSTALKQELRVKEHHQYLATVCIDYCLAINREDLLFNLVFPHFFKADQLGVFLERLEPFILGDKLHKVPPEVIKLLLHYYASNKMLRRMEQIILHLDIASIDFHQVVTLCRKHYLSNALFYVFITALDDYITPMDDMFKVIFKPASISGTARDQQIVLKTVGYKILLYLEYCFAGKVFPLDKEMPTERIRPVNDKIFEYLFAETVQGGTSHITLLVTQSINAHPENNEYPRVIALLGIDTDEFFKALTIACEHPLTVHHLHQAADVLIKLMIDPRDDAFAFNSQPLKGAAFTPAQVGALFRFLARYYSRQFLEPAQYMLNRALSYLLLATDPATATERQALVLSLIKSCPPEKFNPDQVLLRAEKAQFYKVCEYFALKRRDFAKVVHYHVIDPDFKLELFDYIRSQLDSTTLTDKEKEAIKNAVIVSLKEIIKVDREKASNLIIERFDNEHERLMDELAVYPELLYYYLSAIMEHSFKEGRSSLSAEQEEKLINLMAQFEPSKVLVFLQHKGMKYRLDVALQICQKMVLLEPTAYLLERSGDLTGALQQHLDLIGPKLSVVLLVNQTEVMDPHVEEALADDIQRELDKAINLCQRNSQRLEDAENEALWFKLLDCWVEPWRKLKELDMEIMRNRAPRSNTGKKSDASDSDAEAGWHRGSIKEIMKQKQVILSRLQLLNSFIQRVIDNMMGYVALPAILKKIVTDHGSDKFGEFKTIFISMLDNYSYEQNILTTANQLFEYDTYRVSKDLFKRRAQGHLTTPKCQLCGEKFHAWDKAVLFNCSHSFHIECLTSRGTSLTAPQCPTCGETSTYDNNRRPLQDSSRSRSAVGQKSRDRSTAEVYQERVNQLVIPQEKSKLEILHMIQNGEDVTQVRSQNHRHSYRAPTVERNPGMLSEQSKVRSGFSDEEARELFKRRKK